MRATPRRAWRAAYVAAAAVATAAGALGGWRGAPPAGRRLAALTKPIPIALAAGEALSRRADENYRSTAMDTALLVGAVGFSFAGDRAMLLEEFHRDGPAGSPEAAAKDRRLRWGATLFAGTQICYSTLLWRRGARPRVQTLLPRLAILAESGTVMALHRPGLLPVLGPYGSLLATMSALSADSPTEQPGLRYGGMLFLASDFAILNRRHLLHDPRLRVAAELWVLSSYFAAQRLLLTALR